MQHVMYVRSALLRFDTLCAVEYLASYVNIRERCPSELG
jgi:hypothetical protein